ncbi:MAG: 3-dehydroquinate synthase family protein [Holophaga sp.]|nr:3-dehydroquinate synthase family protein [Holophaga sp.]
MLLKLPESFPTTVHILEKLEGGCLPKGPWVLVGDDAIRPLWERAGMPVPPGSRWVSLDETTKRLDTLIPWLEAWAALPLHRDVCIVAAGGGVLTDMVGLAAALFLRGVTWQAWPTTLLSQVDAGLGGKTAVNLTAGKNLAGAFHPPEHMVVCSAFLDTLPLRQLHSGRWELIKMAFLEGDTAWAERLMASPKPDSNDLARALEIKAELVHRDLREAGDRKLLNLGHTLGHALEAASDFRLLHGEAVGLGLLAACFLAEEAGLPAFPPELLQRLAKHLQPLAPEIAPWEACLPWLARDKKIDTGANGTAPAVHCVLPQPGNRATLRFLSPEAWITAHAKLLNSFC